MEIFLCSLLLSLLWHILATIISSATKTNFWWTFTLGPIGTIIAILNNIQEKLEKEKTDTNFNMICD